MVEHICVEQQVDLVRWRFIPGFPQYSSIYPRLSTKLSTNLFTGNSPTIVLRRDVYGDILTGSSVAGVVGVVVPRLEGIL